MNTRLVSSFTNIFTISVLFVALTLTALLLTSCPADKAAREARAKELVVYAYDSFTADWGPGPELARLFTEKTGYMVQLVSCGDAAQVLSRAVLEKKHPAADILVGLDNNLVERARSAEILEKYRSPRSSAVPADLVLSSDWLLTPYDWGFFSIIFDSEAGLSAPASLADLTRPEYAKKLILMDPRTSTPGMGFLAWTVALFGDSYLDYWKDLKPNILTMAPGWDTGYGLFTAGEAPLVISYTTSPAYHLEYENTTRYQALIFKEGHPLQIEGLGVVKNAPNRAAAREFIDFMLSPEAQAVLPLTQWMYPVLSDVGLPESFRAAPQAGIKLSVPAASVQAAIEPVMGLLAQ